ncbi:HAD hydrolase family protein [bacterium]|nr:HAD hydrolase family protein [bacterium]
MTEEELKSFCLPIKLLLFDCDGVFTNGNIVYGINGMEMKFFSSKDGMGLMIWREAGFSCGCVSGRYSEALARRACELEFDELHQNVKDKRSVISEIMLRRKILKNEIAFIGDDINDLAGVELVGLFLAPSDAHKEVLKRANHVLSSRGGQGAVREAIDLILSCTGRLDQIVARMIG